MIDVREIRAIGTKQKRPCQPPTNEPSQEEIKAACREIQEGWSPAERMRRSTPARPVDMSAIYRVVDDEL